MSLMFAFFFGAVVGYWSAALIAKAWYSRAAAMHQQRARAHNECIELLKVAESSLAASKAENERLREECDAAGKLAHGIEADATDLACDVNDLKALLRRLVECEGKSADHLWPVLADAKSALAGEKKL